MNMPTERSDGGSRQGHHMREAHVAEAREIVRDKLPASEILAQMAEECAELAKAALKLRRVLTGDNPTTVSYGMATENVLEECGDVLCCAQVFCGRMKCIRCAIFAAIKQYAGQNAC